MQPRLADKTFIENFKEYVKIKEKIVSKYTTTGAKSCIYTLEKFENATNTTYYLISINKDFKEAFKDYLEKEGYATSTIKLFLTKIKTVCYYFEAEGEKISPYVRQLTKDIVPKKKNEIFLTIQEIESIKRVET